MSIYENIRMGKINAIREEIEEAARQANAHDFIMILPHVCIFNTYINVSLFPCNLEI
jgi:ABC-type multidrug transport system fused ATPase/permease subunit